VLASTQLFINDPICNQTSSHSIEIVNDVLEKLLTVGITDPSEFPMIVVPVKHLTV
jgi:FKBP12-rapamycin complex-associated protein